MRQLQHLFVLAVMLVQLHFAFTTAKTITQNCSTNFPYSCDNSTISASKSKNSLTRADLLFIVNQNSVSNAKSVYDGKVKSVSRKSKPVRKTVRIQKRMQKNKVLKVQKFTLKDAVKVKSASGKFAKRSFIASSVVKPSSLIKSLASPVYAHLANKAMQNAHAIANLMPPIELQQDQPRQVMTVAQPQATVLLSPGVVARQISTSKSSSSYVNRPRPVQVYAPVSPKWTAPVYRQPVRTLPAVTIVRNINPNDYIDDEFPTEPPIRTPPPPPPQPPQQQQQQERIEQQQEPIEQQHEEDHWSTKKSVRPTGQAKKSFQHIRSYYSPSRPTRTRTVLTETKFVPSQTSIVSTTMYSPEKKTTIIDTHHPMAQK